MKFTIHISCEGSKFLTEIYFKYLGEQGVGNAKAELDTAEGRETKLVKELKKLNKKNTSSNLPSEQQQQLNETKDKLEQATREKELANINVDDKVREQEAVKMIRFKVGFNKVVVGYLDLAEKVRHCLLIGTTSTIILIKKQPRLVRFVTFFNHPFDS